MKKNNTEEETKGISIKQIALFCSTGVFSVFSLAMYFLIMDNLEEFTRYGVVFYIKFLLISGIVSAVFSVYCIAYIVAEGYPGNILRNAYGMKEKPFKK